MGDFPGLVSSTDHRMQDGQCLSHPLIDSTVGPAWPLPLPLERKEIVSREGCRAGERKLINGRDLFMIRARLGRFPAAQPLAVSRGL